MKIDLHCHTKYSGDNYFEPEWLIQEAFDKGLDGICVTEHFSVEASKPVDDIEIPRDFFVFRGVEISTDMGHVLAFGMEDDSWNIWGRYSLLDMKKAVEAVRAAGGVCIPSHPFRGFNSLAEHAFDRTLFDAVETVNAANLPGMNQQAQKMALKTQMVQTGGSDCHGPGRVGTAYTVFENPVTNIQDLVCEIALGRCRPGSQHP